MTMRDIKIGTRWIFQRKILRIEKKKEEATRFIDLFVIRV